jgi:hypothetical protein
VVTKRRAWGVFRELAHSPGRETDDADILRAAGAALEADGFDVAYRTPDELPPPGSAGSDVPPFLFVMCERLEALARLRALERAGALVVNAPQAVENTYRDLTVGLFQKEGVAFPRSAIVPTAGRVPAVAAHPVWVKRADVHATQEGDVLFVDSDRALGRALDSFAARGIGRAVIQEHVPGDLLKFYGIGREGDGGEAPWFRSFYHRNQTLAGHRFDPEALRRTAFHAAAALGVEVFGGDAIAGPDGRLSIIDLNAWPSFALYRAEAGPRIARHLSARFLAAAGVSR